MENKMTELQEEGIEILICLPEWNDIKTEVVPTLTKKEQKAVLSAMKWIQNGCPVPKVNRIEVCGLPTEGHSKGTCTKHKDHDGYCWFPNMWNDM